MSLFLLFFCPPFYDNGLGNTNRRAKTLLLLQFSYLTEIEHSAYIFSDDTNDSAQIKCKLNKNYDIASSFKVTSIFNQRDSNLVRFIAHPGSSNDIREDQIIVELSIII